MTPMRERASYLVSSHSLPPGWYYHCTSGCPSTTRFHAKREWAEHERLKHGKDWTCECGAVYSKYTSYRQHIYHKQYDGRRHRVNDSRAIRALWKEEADAPRLKIRRVEGVDDTRRQSTSLKPTRVVESEEYKGNNLPGLPVRRNAAPMQTSGPIQFPSARPARMIPLPVHRNAAPMHTSGLIQFPLARPAKMVPSGINNKEASKKKNKLRIMELEVKTMKTRLELEEKELALEKLKQEMESEEE